MGFSSVKGIFFEINTSLIYVVLLRSLQGGGVGGERGEEEEGWLEGDGSARSEVGRREAVADREHYQLQFSTLHTAPLLHNHLL